MADPDASPAPDPAAAPGAGAPGVAAAPGAARRRRRRAWWTAGAALTALAVALVVVALDRLVHAPPVTPVVAADHAPARFAPPQVAVASPVARTVEPYRGLGSWVDAFDFSPAYAGPNPAFVPATIDAMAAAGVRTVYVQAARSDPRSPGLLEDRWLLAELLLRAHQRDLAVVAWYLPKWTGDGVDEAKVRAMADFSVLGQRFDGVAVDIEWNADKLPVAERNVRFVALSRAAKASVADQAVGAIVMPPVVTEVLSPTFWPTFPWDAVAPLYDVWLPMGYWSVRSPTSEWRDSYRYTTENVRRLRADLRNEAAPVHVVGGIGALDGIDDKPNPEEPLASIGDLDGFARAAKDTGAIGASIYDWATTETSTRERLRALFAGP